MQVIQFKFNNVKRNRQTLLSLFRLETPRKISKADDCMTT